MDMELHELSEEQRLMRQTCRAFVDDIVDPFIRALPAMESEARAGSPR